MRLHDLPLAIFADKNPGHPHRPFGAVDVELSNRITWKSSWGMYDYDEKDNPVDYIGHRSFRGNLVTLAVECKF